MNQKNTLTNDRLNETNKKNMTKVMETTRVLG
jgi:hypothetical protein